MIPDCSEPPRPSFLRRLLQAAAWSLIVIISAYLFFRWWHMGDCTRRLNDAIAAADRDDPGWRLEDLLAKREPVPDEENSAKVMMRVMELKPKGMKDWLPTRALPSGEYFMPQVVPWETPPNREFPPEYLVEVNTMLTNVAPCIALARTLSHMPRGSFQINWDEKRCELSIREFECASAVRELLKLDGYARLSQGDLSGVLIRAKAIAYCANALADAPSATAQSWGRRCLDDVRDLVERLLAHGALADKELIEMQTILREDARRPHLLSVHRASRAEHHTLFIRPEAAAHLELCARLIRRIKWGFEDGPKESEEQLAWRADLRQSLTPRVRLVRENHSHFLALANRLVEVSKQPPHQAFRAIDTLTREYEQAEADHPDEYFKILSSASSTKLGKSILKNLALTHCTCVGIACERFRSKHGRWPDTLNQLVPEFMDELPIDPFDGKPIKATRTKEGFTVYSSGYDGKDDGGTLHDQNGEYDRGPDIGFRLWDPKHRRLPPVPKPKPVVETEDPVKDPPPPS